MITFKYVALDTGKDNYFFIQLCQKYRQLLMPSYTEDEVFDFLTRDNPRLMCAIVLYHGQRMVGFTTIGFYHKVFEETEVVIARISTGVEKGFRGGALPLELMWEKLAAYKKLAGDTPMYFAGFIANPIMYNAVAESIWEYYPRPSQEPSKEINRMLKQLKGMYGSNSDDDRDFTFRAPFCVNIDEQVQEAINISTNENVLYYRRLNPGYLHGHILVVIAPLTEENIRKSIDMVYTRRAARNAA